MLHRLKGIDNQDVNIGDFVFFGRLPVESSLRLLAIRSLTVALDDFYGARQYVNS